MPRSLLLFLAATILSSAWSPVGFCAPKDSGAADRHVETSSLTATDIYESFVGDNNAKRAEEWFVRAEKLLQEAERAEPENGRWKMGRAFILDHNGDRTAARKLAEKAAKLTADDADIQYWVGNFIFQNIGDVGFLDKGALSKRGKKAYERAIELDPEHVDASMGLAQFYLYAPGIAGGSKAKARELAERILEIEGAEFEGALLLGQIEAQEKHWDKCAAIFRQAANDAQDDADRLNALMIGGQMLHIQAKKPKKALPFLEEAAAMETGDNVSPNFLLGSVYKDLGRLDEALEKFVEVLKQSPEAPNTLFYSAQIYEEQERFTEAIAHYRRFIKAAPKDDRVKKAKKKIKKLKKKLR